ncbi:MAG: IspD/TarI family cytidylyltransferase, partial [Candidatus Margulisiibacteriota bacterium]
MKPKKLRNIAIIVAGGKGKRMGLASGKQFLKIAGKPMVEWTICAFQKNKIIDGIILVVAKENLKRAKKLKFSKIIRVVVGGKERQDSVRKGLEALPSSAEIVVIHDGARPAVADELIT